MAVEVTYSDTDEGARIYVGSGKSRIEWSPDMWESSVWEPVVTGKLPAMASELGQRVRWAHLDFTADEWTAFVGAVKSGELSTEAIVGG